MRKQSGFSMVEIMIGVALIGVVVAWALEVNVASEDQTTGRNKADTLSSFQQLVGQYFIANRTEIEAAMAGDSAKADLHCRINVASDGTGGSTATNATKRTCALDGTQLRAKGLWPSGMTMDHSYGRYVAIIRQIMSSDATPVATGADEMIIVLAPLSAGNVMTGGTVSFTGDIKRTGDEIQANMTALGGTGGYVPPGEDFGPCQYNTTTKEVCGNGWKITLSDFIN